MERRRARGNKWLDKVRKGNRKGGEKTKRVLEQRQEASRDWVRMEEDRTVKKKRKKKGQAERAGESGEEENDKFPKA